MSDSRLGRVTDAFLLLFVVALPFSIAVSEIALGGVIVSWLWTRPWTRPAVPRALVVATLALVATWLLATATAADPGASLWRVRKIWSVVLVFVVADRAREAGFARRLAATAIAAGALSALFGLALFVSVRLGGLRPGYRLESVFSTAMTTGNVFATLGVAALGEALLAELRAGWPRRLAWAAAIVIALALVLTLTRSSWIGFAAGAALLLGVRRPRALVAVVLAGALALAIGPAELKYRAASIFDPTYETNAGRISLWRSGLAVVRDHPWTGVGLADHYALIERYRRPDATFHAGHFHNNLVQVAASTGLIGLAAWVGWMLLVAVLLARGAFRKGSGRALTGLAVGVAFQVFGLFDWAFGDAEVANQFFLWTGLGLASLAASAAGFPGFSGHPVRPLSGPSPPA